MKNCPRKIMVYPDWKSGQFCPYGVDRDLPYSIFHATKSKIQILPYDSDPPEGRVATAAHQSQD